MADRNLNALDAIQIHARLGNALHLVLHALRNGDTDRAANKAAQALDAYRAFNAIAALEVA